MQLLASLQSKKERICVVGLGYVGLPLAVALSKHFDVVGFDIKEQRIQELKESIDRTNEVSTDALKSVSIDYSSNPAIIKSSKFIIIAVPTPVDKNNIPDLRLVENATALVGRNLSVDSIVVYESTVYPGVTEEICLPILEKESGLKAGINFKIGYSPERINPGDKKHTIDKVIKIVSGMDVESLEIISGVYGSVTKVFKADSIKVAEAAKVIENTQRDLNIALMNELAVIFSKMNISTYDVLKAAGTKWNFLNFYPGLVGGHCIGVDPYYLTHKAQELGYKPEVILSGRHINDSMGSWVVEEILRKIDHSDLKNLKVLIAGITFKENVPDIRNSKIVDIYNHLKKHGISPQICDPIADKDEVFHEYGIELGDLDKIQGMDLLIVAVAHDQFKQMKLNDWKKVLSAKAMVADVKGIFNKEEIKKEGFQYWSM